jgi:hypothetical protein
MPERFMGMLRVFGEKWRRVPESNRCTRICNPLRHHSANSPLSSGSGRLDHPADPRKPLCHTGCHTFLFCSRSFPLRLASPDALAQVPRLVANLRGALTRDGSGQFVAASGKKHVYRSGVAQVLEVMFQRSIASRAARMASAALRYPFCAGCPLFDRFSLRINRLSSSVAFNAAARWGSSGSRAWSRAALSYQKRLAHDLAPLHPQDIADAVAK